MADEPQIPEELQETLQQIRNYNQQIAEISQQKAEVEEKLDEERRTRDMLNSIDGDSQMYKRLGAGYVVETEYETAETDVEEEIDRLEQKADKLERILSAMESEYEDLQEVLREQVEESDFQMTDE